MPDFYDPERRRSLRMARAIPLTVIGTDSVGQSFRELTTTITVNRHGCTYRSKHSVPKNSTVALEIAQADSVSPARHVQGRVAWVQRPRTVRQLFQIALEFEKPTDIWGITLPPGNRFIPAAEERNSHAVCDPQTAGKKALELVEEVEEIIVEESADDTVKDHRSPASQPRKIRTTANAHGKRRSKKKKGKS